MIIEEESDMQVTSEHEMINVVDDVCISDDECNDISESFIYDHSWFVEPESQFQVDSSVHYVYNNGKIEQRPGHCVNDCFYRYKNTHDYGVFYYCYDYRANYDHESYQIRIDKGRDLSKYFYGKDENLIVLIKSDLQGVLSKTDMDSTIVRMMSKYPTNCKIFSNMGYQQLENNVVGAVFDVDLLDEPMLFDVKDNGYDPVYQVALMSQIDDIVFDDISGELSKESKIMYDTTITNNIVGGEHVQGVKQSVISFIKSIQNGRTTDFFFNILADYNRGCYEDKYDDWLKSKSNKVSAGVVYMGSTSEFDYFLSYFVKSKKNKFKFVYSHRTCLCSMFNVGNYFLLFYKVPHYNDNSVRISDINSNFSDYKISYRYYDRKFMNSLMLRLFVMCDDFCDSLNYAAYNFSRNYFERRGVVYVDKWNISVRDIDIDVYRVYGLLIDYCDLINSRELLLSRSN